MYGVSILFVFEISKRFKPRLFNDRQKKLACSKLRENMPFFEHKHAKFTISSK